MHGLAGMVGHMGNAPGAMAAFACQVQAALGFGIEVDTMLLQPSDGLGALSEDAAHSGFIAEAGTGDQRVLHMGFEFVILVQHGGDAALCPGAGAFMQRAFAEDGDAQMLGQAEGNRQSGQPGADDEHIGRHIGVLMEGMAGGSGGTELMEQGGIQRHFSAGAYVLAAGSREVQHALYGLAGCAAQGWIEFDGALAVQQSLLHTLQAVHGHPGAEGAAFTAAARACRGRGQKGLAWMAQAHSVKNALIGGDDEGVGGQLAHGRNQLGGGAHHIGQCGNGSR